MGKTELTLESGDFQASITSCFTVCLKVESRHSRALAPFCPFPACSQRVPSVFGACSERVRGVFGACLQGAPPLGTPPNIDPTLTTLMVVYGGLRLEMVVYGGLRLEMGCFVGRGN